MNYYLATHPYRMARRMAHLARMAEEMPDRDFRLAVDVQEQDDVFIINALTPGLKAEDLNIQVLDSVVTIEGEFKSDETEYLLNELPHGTFRRSLDMQTTLDAGKAEAKITDGVLTLRLPKAESARPKTVKVAVK